MISIPKVLPRKPGVYTLTCQGNGRVYVGGTTDLQKRKARHVASLRKGKGHNRALKDAYDLYGEDSFVFTAIELDVPLDQLHDREQHWIDTLNALDPTTGFNSWPKAKSPKGLKHSEETRRKVSAALTGHPVSAEQRLKVSRSLRGLHKTDEHKKNLSVAMKKAGISEEGLKNIRESNRKRIGKKMSPEACRNISLAQMGRVQSEETKAKISAARRGQKMKEEVLLRVAANRKPFSEESRRRISEATRKMWAERKARGWESHEKERLKAQPPCPPGQSEL